MRLKEYSEKTPKPMVEIGYRPILWHLMHYYAHFGHKEFILCLGYRGDLIKSYFTNYSEWLSNDFVLSNGGRDIFLYNRDFGDWTISFIDTGLHSNIGQRLKQVEKYLGNDPIFLANYSDGLTDLNFQGYFDYFCQQDKIASLLSVKPSQSFHVLSVENDGLVNSISPARQTDIWVNGGFFIFKKEIFKYMQEGEELVLEPFQRLIDEKQLVAYRYDGFWAGLDTFKEKQIFDDMYARGKKPWAVWQTTK